ncbi:MAG: hypothetical protein IJ011_10545 [Clostridia bacterium]|nr:hypothetical protein [Clostridia bacterium]MBQ8850760.1 hypothetical protein [Clostridia bacterium]
MNEKRQLFIVVGVILLAIAVIIGGIVISKKIDEELEQERREAEYKAKIEPLMEDFKSYYSDLSFEIEYRVLDYGGHLRVVYYIDGDKSIEDYFLARKKDFYKGFSPLVKYGTVEHIIIYINGEEFTEIDDWFEEKERYLSLCRDGNCPLTREYGSDYCEFHQPKH